MTRSIQDKLHSVVAEIEEKGHANQTRLTSLKKWLAEPGHQPTLGLWVAARAAATADAVDPAEPCLLELADKLLAGWAPTSPAPDRVQAKLLHGRIKSLQEEHHSLRWGPCPPFASRSLRLVEEGLDVYLYHPDAPTLGYRLAVDSCQPEHPTCGGDLSGPSRERLLELIDLIDAVEAEEGVPGADPVIAV